MASYHEFTTAEDTAITLTDAQLLVGSSDIDANDVLSIDNVVLKDPANGTLISNGDGTYTFNPSHNYSGSAIELNYTLTDTGGATSTQDVMIHVTPVNDAPTLVIDTGNLNNASDTVSESALPFGTDPSSDVEFAYGHFTISDPEGLSDIQSLTLGTTQFTVGTGGLADLVGSTINTPNGVVTLTGYSNGIFDYTFELKTPTINIPNELETNSFLVQVTDSAGVSNAPTEVIINIIDDDTPIVKDYTITSEGSVTIGTVNLVIILDRSGSMVGSSGTIELPDGSQTTRLDLAKEAIANLIEAYGSNLNSVLAVSFSDQATSYGWMSGSNAVTTFNALTANGYTDYDHALSVVQTNYGTPSAADHTYVYFLSDGAPTSSDGFNANSVNATEHTAWVNFLTTHVVDKAFAVGIGEDITSNQALSHLDTVAWSSTEPNQPLTWNGSGVVNPTTTHNVNTLVAADPTDLSAILIGTVDIQDGNIVTDTNSGSMAGADGWADKALVSLSYDGTNDGIDNPTVYTFPTLATEHTIVFGGERGSLTISGDGTYSYTPSENPDGTPFYLTYTAQDSDGSVSLPAKLWIDVNDAPIAHSDNVITNIFISNFTIPGHLLAVNDTDSDGDRLSAPDVTVATGWTKGGDFTASTVQTIDFDAHNNNNSNKFVELDRSDFSKTGQLANTATLIVDGYLDNISSSNNNDEDVLTVALNANEVLTLDHNINAGDISMAYREGTSGAWTSITDGNSFTALSDGDYQIRVVNTDDNGSSGGGTGDENYLLTMKIDYANAEASTPLVNGTYEVSDGALSDDGVFTLNYQSGSDLNGTDDDDVLIGGSGSDTLYGGEDNDVLVYDSADSQIDGGDGVDSLLIGDSAIDFDLIDDVKLENIEVIDLSRADVSITNLNPQDVFDMTDDTNTILKIVGDSSDSVASTIISGEDSPWNVSVDQTDVDEGFTRYEGVLPDSTPVYIDVQDSIVHTDFD